MLRPSKRVSLLAVLSLSLVAVLSLTFIPRTSHASASGPSNVPPPTTGYTVGDVAPGFTAFDQNGNGVSLRDFYGRFVILDLSAVSLTFIRE